MENSENEYGVDYDENGPMKKGYRGRSATTGRYVHRPYMEVMRDMDMPNKMYYGGEMQSRDGENRGYTAAIEGDKYQTVNEYLARVYQRHPGDRYDRFVGFGIAFSGK